MHLSLEVLLELRDGRGAPGERAHATACAACAAEIERLRGVAADLRALPVLTPSRDRWPAIRAAHLAGSRRRRLTATSATILALAASFLAMAVLPRIFRAPAGPVMRLENGSEGSGEVASLMSESRRLEDLLSGLEPSRGVLDVRTAGATLSLEDEIALIDSRLAAPESRAISRQEIRRLWQQRVDLMNRLIRAHDARTTYVGL